MGGSNGISSVDLSNSYNGVAGYNVGLVGILTFVSNWAGPIWWATATVMLLLQNESGLQRSSLRQSQVLLTSFTVGGLLSVMTACTMLKDHLFIWTVFSPKYLFTTAWSLGQHLLINIAFCSGLYGIAS